MASLLCTVGEGTDNLLARIKGAVAMEYIPAGEHFEEGSLNILVMHNDCFEWMDVSLAIPASSDREYPDPRPYVNTAKLSSISR